MILTLVHEDEQVLLKSAPALSEKAGGHGWRRYALAAAGPWCQPSSFLLGLLVCDAAVHLFPGLHMA